MSEFNMVNQYCQTGQTGNWKFIGPHADYYGKSKDYAGRVTAIWVNPSNKNHILAGSGNGGIFKTLDGGRNWVNITDGPDLKQLPGSLGIGSIAVHPMDHNIIYAATGSFAAFADLWDATYSTGIIKSTDGGNTWSIDTDFRDRVTSAHSLLGIHMKNRTNPFSFTLKFSPNGRLFAVHNKYILCKRDNVTPWEDITPTNWLDNFPTDEMKNNVIWRDVEFSKNPLVKTAVFCTDVGDYDINYLYYLNYETMAWSLAPSEIHRPESDEYSLAEMAITKNNNLLFIYYSPGSSIHGTSTAILYKTSFVPASPMPVYINYLKINANLILTSDKYEDIFYVTNVSGNPYESFVEKTIDGGLYFSSAGNTHADGRCITGFFGNDATGLQDEIYCGTDGGVALKPAGSEMSHSISGKGLNIAQFYGLSTNLTDDRKLTGGTQDNSSFAYQKGELNPWVQFSTGDNINPIFSINGLSKVVVQYQFGLNNLYNFDDLSTLTEDTITEHINDISFGYVRWMRPLKTSPSNKMQFGGYFLHERDFESGTWTSIFGNNDKLYGDPKQHLTAQYDDATMRASVRAYKTLVDFEIDQNNPKIAYVAYNLATGAPTGETQGNLFYTENADEYFESDHTRYPTWELRHIENEHFRITDILIDPANSSRIWVSYGGVPVWFAEVPPSERKNKVYYSDDNGETFTDVSKGLTIFPVTKLVYVPGTDDMIFAATDMGVYRWDKPSQSWHCFSEGMPRCLISDIEYIPCSGRLRASTYGRGIWEVELFKDQPNFYPSATKTIQSNTTWSSSQTLNGSVRIQSGATLTIEGASTTIFMPLNATIYVEKGAKLIVDNARITNSCDSTRWGGIELEGDKDASATAMNMGSVEIRNNAIIENAKVGVADYTGNSEGGGMLHITNSTFLNCWKGISLNDYAYEDRSASVVVENVNFILTDAGDPMKAVSHGIPPHMVTVWNQYGVTLKECLFKDERTVSMLERGTAVYSLDASLNIEGNTFQQLYRGIYSIGAFSGNGVPTCYIRNNEFDNFREGILTSNLPMVVLDNAFSNLQGTSNAHKAWGMYIDGSMGATVNNNSIVATASTSNYAYGIIIRNSGNLKSSVVTNNVMKNLLSGLQAEGYNPKLRFNCNTFENNDYGITINPESGMGAGAVINAQNGSCSAGLAHSRPNNIFSSNTIDIKSWITTPANNLAYYVNVAANPSYIPSVVDNVTIQECTSLSSSDPSSCAYLVIYPWSSSTFSTALSAYQAANSSQPLDIFKLDHSYQELVRAYLQTNDRPGLLNFLLSEGSEMSKLHLMSLYIHNAEIPNAQSLLPSISSNQEEQTAYAQYFNILINAKQSNTAIDKLDSVAVQTLQSLSTETYRISGAARNLLTYHYGRTWQPQPESLPKLAQRPAKQNTQLHSYMLDPRPNPSIGRTTIEAFISQHDASYEPAIKIYDMNGKLLMSYKCQGGTNSFEVDVTNWNSGIYLCVLSINDKQITSKKLVKQ